MKLILLCLFFYGCAQTVSNLSIDDQLAKAPRCNGYVSKADCDDGDSVIFAGLLCLAGVEDGCLTVRDSQDDDGRFWRSPRRNPGNIGKNNSFSRDQALGVLAYLAKTKDVDAANRWIHWIDKNRPCIITMFGKCKYYGLHRYCKDDDDSRCTITPTMFQMMYYVWKDLGLEPYKTMNTYKNTPLLSPAKKGYQIHLYAVQEFIKQKMDRGDDRAVKKILEKEPTNPFYMYLAEGKSSAVIERYNELCPTGDHPKKQWAWERLAEEQAWKKSMVWDCIFMEAL